MSNNVFFDSFVFISGDVWFFYSFFELVPVSESKEGAFGYFNIAFGGGYAVGGVSHKSKIFSLKIKASNAINFY